MEQRTEVTGYPRRMADKDPFVVTDAAAWRVWLDANEDTSEGVWLVLAKKGATAPTTLTYAEALEHALCSGWIDGQKASMDAATFLQRFTPRRKASLWSKRNVEIVGRLVDEGRMRPRGQAEIDRAKGDGRWDRAYSGASTAQVPDDLAAALAAEPAASALFAQLDATNRYAVLHRVMTAPTAVTRANRVARLVDMLARGETPHPRP